MGAKMDVNKRARGLPNDDDCEQIFLEGVVERTATFTNNSRISKISQSMGKKPLQQN